MTAPQSLVVSGCGVLGPFGVGEDSLAAALDGELDCFGPCTLFGTDHRVAQVRDFRITDHVRNPKAQRSPRISQFALAAASAAIRQAGLNAKSLGADATALVYGTGNGPAAATERSLDAIVGKGLGAVEPLVFQESVFNAPASLISIDLAIKGPVVVLPMCWTAGLHALKLGIDMLRLGRVQRVLVVAADELAATTHMALDGLGFVSPNDGREEATRPFDPRVNGAVFGEGAAALVIEPEAEVATRGGRARARIAGCAIGTDSLGAAPADTSGAALARVMDAALAAASWHPADLDHLLAGTIVTAASDQAELAAIARTMARRPEPCPVSSLKAAIGELMGPAALIGIVTAIMELEQGRRFGTLGLERPPSAGATFPGATTDAPMRRVMVNATGVSGTYGCALLEAPA